MAGKTERCLQNDILPACIIKLATVVPSACVGGAH